MKPVIIAFRQTGKCPGKKFPTTKSGKSGYICMLHYNDIFQNIAPKASLAGQRLLYVARPVIGRSLSTLPAIRSSAVTYICICEICKQTNKTINMKEG